MLAADLGAEAVWLKAPDVTEALLAFARDARVTRIIVGRARHGLGARLRHRSVIGELIARGREFEIEVVGFAKRERGNQSSQSEPVGSRPSRRDAILCLGLWRERPPHRNPRRLVKP